MYTLDLTIFGRGVKVPALICDRVQSCVLTASQVITNELWEVGSIPCVTICGKAVYTKTHACLEKRK